MSSSTVAQHTTQPLNFGPEWLRALSTPDATTPIPASGASSSGNIFKFSTTKYRYSKDQILALRANVTERLAEEVRNEILENLRDVESVFRPNIIEPLALTAPSSEETAKMSSLSSYISGRTPGGGGRGGHSSQQPQQPQESRARGGSAVSNGRGGSGGGGARGRGGRETNFGPTRGNNNGDEHGENGAGGDEGSSSWSRGGGLHSRGGSAGGGSGSGGGGAFTNRVRSFDDREQSQAFRRGGGAGGTRQTSEAWRRSRGDEDEANDQNEDPAPATGSASWTSRGSATRRGGGAGPIENRTKSNDQRSYNDDRPGSSNSYESNQPRATGGWRTNSNMSDRDQNFRRPQAKRDRIPEWMDDNNEGDNPIISATFEHGTFTGSASSARSNTNNSNEQQKLQTQSSSEDLAAQPAQAVLSKPQEEVKPEKTTPPRTDTAVTKAPTKSETTTASKPTPSIQQKQQQQQQHHHSIPACDDDFEPSDVATTVVEATLAEDHDYSPPMSSHSTPHPMSMESKPTTVPIIPQPQRLHSAPAPTTIIDDKQWFYRDPQNTVQGPFSAADMERWFAAGYFTTSLPVKRFGEAQFSTIQQLFKELGRLPFRSDAPSHPSAAPAVQPQQPIVSEAQKFNPMAYSATPPGNSAYLEEYLMQQQQQQQRQNIQHSMLFNRQTSMPSSSNDRKPAAPPSMVASQMQSYFGSQQQLSSSLFPTNLGNDPAAAYQQQQAPQLQRSISATNQQAAPAALFDEMQRAFRQAASASNASMLFGNNMSGSQSQQPEDIMTRLTQAMQSHGQQQQEKVDEQRRMEQQRRELDIDRLKLAEQMRLQREEDERRRMEIQQQQQQQQKRLEEEMRKKQETSLKNQLLLEQMKEMTKANEQKKPQQQAPAPKSDIDAFLAFTQSVQFQKDQQAKIEAQKAENIRRYQEQSRQSSHPSPPAQPQSNFKLPDAANWARHSSQSNEQSSQPLNFAEIQKQEQEQERRVREAAMSAQHLAKSDAMNIPTSSSSGNKAGSWARTLFAGGTAPGGNNALLGSSQLSSSEQDTMETTLPESPISSYNQQATNAPKSRSTSHQQSVPWNTANTTTNTSLQDIQRQQALSEAKQQQQLQQQQQQQQSQQQQQAQSLASAHSSSSTAAWGGIFSQSSSSPQTSSSSMFWGDSLNPPPSSSSSAASKPSSSSNKNNNKPSTPWSELKPVATSSSAASAKSHSAHAELSKSEREAKYLFNTTRTQDALSKWTQTQFKDLQAIDVPTLVQLLKDIETSEEIIEYVQPYIGSVTKAREFARDFIVKRKQLANVEPELDNERLNALAMAPTSSSSNSGNAGDEGFQLASSNGQKKKAKKMKGQKIDVKQLGFMVNNRPEHRDDIDRVM